jgi:hypothetical protein
MRKLTRPATGEEVLQISDCPCCGGEIVVGDCGYSTFNPGWAECKRCKRKWSFECVDDSWDAGKRWNEKARVMRRELFLLSCLQVKNSGPTISRNFNDEEIEREAKKMLKRLKEIVIDADKPKSR